MEGKEKLNIIIFSWRGIGHPDQGGAEVSTHEHAKGWIKAGHTVVLFTSLYPGALHEETIDGVNFIRQGSQAFGVQIEAYKWYIFAKHPKFDLVIDQFHGIPFFTPIYIRGVKKLGFIHEVAKEVWGLNPWSRPFNLLPAIIGRILEPLIFRIFYQNIPFMTVSNSTKMDLISWGISSDKITVIYNGFSISKFNPHDKEKNPTIIFLGALTKDKGIESALKVFHIVNKSLISCNFWVVGKAEFNYKVKLKKIAEKLKIDKKAKFYGFVNEKKKFQLLSRASILLNTSVREGWGLVVIEAAAVGTPTVAFDVPGLRDSIINGETGITDKNHSVNSIANEIINLINDKKRYKEMKKQAVNWSKRYSWKEATIESLYLINKIARNKD